MKSMKRTVIGIAFAAMLALTFVASGTNAYASPGKGQGQGPTNTTPAQQTGGLFQALGITWE